MKKAVVIIEGGVVQAVLVNDPGMEVMVIDYDVDRAEPELLTQVSQARGTADAYVYEGEVVEYDPGEVKRLFKLLK